MQNGIYPSDKPIFTWKKNGDFFTKNATADDHNSLVHMLILWSFGHEFWWNWHLGKLNLAMKLRNTGGWQPHRQFIFWFQGNDLVLRKNPSYGKKSTLLQLLIELLNHIHIYFWRIFSVNNCNNHTWDV